MITGDCDTTNGDIYLVPETSDPADEKLWFRINGSSSCVSLKYLANIFNL